MFLGLFNCPSLGIPDLATIEMFAGINYSNKLTLAKKIDGVIDVRMDPSGEYLYLAEMSTGDIYRISPVEMDDD